MGVAHLGNLDSCFIVMVNQCVWAGVHGLCPCPLLVHYCVCVFVGVVVQIGTYGTCY